MADTDGQYGSIGALEAAVSSDPALEAAVVNVADTYGFTADTPITEVLPDPTTGTSSTLVAGGAIYKVVAGSNNVFFGQDTSGKPVLLIGDANSTIVMKDGVPTVVDGLNAAAAGKTAFTLIEASGNNTAVINKGPSQVFSTTGNDTIRSTGGKDTITGGTGQDSITAGGKSLVIAGSTGDTIHGGLKATAHDTIYATGGKDTIYVSRGNNVIVGASGADYLQAGVGSDTIYGGNGKNTIYGGGSTTIEAGKRNTIHLTGSDVLGGGAGPSTVFSADGNQYIQGARGALNIHVAKTADDTIFGGSGHTVVHIAESSGSITHQKTADHITSITFKGGQTLEVAHVTVVFTDKTKTF